MGEYFDLVVVGTSFASSFFLHEYLKAAKPSAKILVLERGKVRAWKQTLLEKSHAEQTLEDVAIAEHPHKRWISHLTFGGNSNCWWGSTPRFHPSDFSTKTRYGVGEDWPFSYEVLDPYYVEAEALMSVAGPNQEPCIPRSVPLPQPPHKMTDPEKIMQGAYPEHFFSAPSARPRLPTENRPACCASARCGHCPIDAKFRVQNEMMGIYQDPRVQVRCNAEVTHLDCTAGRARRVMYRLGGKQMNARADLFALGANAFFNAAILQRSGVEHEWLGRGLGEQASYVAKVLLDGVNCFQGSTSLTAHGYMLYDGPHRSERAGCLLEFNNVPKLRPEPGRWREIVEVKMIFEDIPLAENRVTLAKDGRAKSIYSGCSEYTKRSLSMRHELLEKALAPLPVEKILLEEDEIITEAHIQGTCRMGKDAEHGVVDENLRLHSHRNVFALGAGSFPTCPSANPTLTLSALSLKAARSLWN